MGVSPLPAWAETVGTLDWDALREWEPDEDDVEDLLLSDGGEPVELWCWYWWAPRRVEREADEVEKDCSNGLGSRSRLLRRGGRATGTDDADVVRAWDVGGECLAAAMALLDWDASD